MIEQVSTQVAYIFATKIISQNRWIKLHQILIHFLYNIVTINENTMILDSIIEWVIRKTA